MQFMSTLRQNYNKQTSKNQSRKTKSSKITKSSQNKSSAIVCLYHIDSIYQGTVNASHYRDGFGIVQSLSFHNFFGHFKNGRAQGLCLIILNSGARIYGNFVKDQLNGMGLIDDGKFLKLGIWNKFELNGIGYQFDGQKYLWRMVKFYKNSVIEVIKEEACNLQGKVPTLINLEHTLYILLHNYLQNKYFPENSEQQNIADQKQGNQNLIEGKDSKQIQSQSNRYVHFQGPRIIYFGRMHLQKQQGLGVKFDISDKSVIETGFYQSGRLRSFGFKNNNTIKYKQMGMYIEGKKQGLFMHDDGKQATFCLYRQNNYLQPLQINGREVLRKKQRQYNYSKKEFMSQKNTLDLDLYENLAAKTCKKTEVAVRQSNEVGNDMNRENSRKDLDKILGVRVKQQVTKSRLRDNDIKMNEASKTSLSVLKQKFKYFQVLNTGNHENHTDNLQRVQLNKKSADFNDDPTEYKDHREYLMSRQLARRRTNQEIVQEQDQIAQEENPFAYGVSENEQIRKMMPERVQKHWM